MLPSLLLIPVLGLPGFVVAMVVTGIAVFAIVLVGSTLSTAMGVLYQTALYRHARTGLVSLPYTPETLVDAWAPYRQP